MTVAGFSGAARAIPPKISPEHMKTILSFGMGVESSYVTRNRSTGIGLQSAARKPVLHVQEVMVI
jgi:hypothetical protein